MNKPDLTVRAAYPRAGAVRRITEEERLAFERDGAVVLKGIVPLQWVDYMREAVKGLMERSDPSSQNYADEGEPRFFAQAFPWLSDDRFKAFAVYGPLKDIPHQIWPDAREIYFFYDQVFVKEPGTSKPTPWHQDFPYLPLKGEQIVRIWVPLDRVTRDSGAVHYLKGSHKWGAVYRPFGFKEVPETREAYADPPFPDEQPDFDAEYEKYDWMIGEVEPGDAIIFHPRTVHGAYGNRTELFRRSVTVIYVSDQVKWNPHSANMFNNKDLTGHVQMPVLEPGGPIECALFPRVWP
ncbi:phytanoyl-CoA dioxygenase family protein [Kyrpidia tusciae]|uniref:Phytanoyl-CoA dioxygenase n=1 Tax=Kyrpidia tusciae (strain DSM 2912 / NBRC 15312 / T2) TaxID=562970 RepID=D5WUA4_KYRT2|nr:phytanoyl-CoA dioxygenase family protein [Kyrpidia tusciae]ADG07356.1 Phytanoyl-CoA dioxygenase [Kyrpidia tusciae DSM 2912]